MTDHFENNGSTTFVWNLKKAELNVKNHEGISFGEARTIFDNPEFVTVLDKEHSDDEERYITIGFSKGAKLLIVAHTDRNDTIRIITARKATRKEAEFYANAK
jgi:uncharacterized DUF497 family protein